MTYTMTMHLNSETDWSKTARLTVSIILLDHPTDLEGTEEIWPRGGSLHNSDYGQTVVTTDRLGTDRPLSQSE